MSTCTSANKWKKYQLHTGTGPLCTIKILFTSLNLILNQMCELFIVVLHHLPRYKQYWNTSGDPILIIAFMIHKKVLWYVNYCVHTLALPFVVHRYVENMYGNTRLQHIDESQEPMWACRCWFTYCDTVLCIMIFMMSIRLPPVSRCCICIEAADAMLRYIHTVAAQRTAAQCDKAAQQKLFHTASVCGCCIGSAAACRSMLRGLKIRSANCWSHQRKPCSIWWVRGFKMVSEFARESSTSCEFGHLRYLYPPSRSKLLPLVTVKLLSLSKLKEQVLVRFHLNDRTILRNSVHFCTHFFADVCLLNHSWWKLMRPSAWN